MNYLKQLFSLLVLLGLAACGGGGGSAGTPPFGSPGGATDLTLVLSAPTIANTGTATVTATATALDANRNIVPGVSVTISADSGAVVAPSGTVTDAAGSVTAAIGIGSDRTNRRITVTARSGSVERTATLEVVSEGGGTAAASDLTLVLSSASLTNAIAAAVDSSVTATVTAVDQNRNAVPGIPVTISVDSSAVAEVSSKVTNASGAVSAKITIGGDRSNRVVTVTATSGSLSRTASFRVTGAKLASSVAPLVVAGTSNNVIEYTLLDFNAIAMANQPISVVTPGLPTVSGTTDLNGKFRYVYTAPATAGPITIVATAAGDSRSDSITVSGGTGAVPPAIADQLFGKLEGTTSVVTANSSGSGANLVELRVLVRDTGDRAVPRVRVRFDLADNANTNDGKVSWVGDYAYTDDNGVARANFIPGQKSGPVTVRACFSARDFAFGDNGCGGIGSDVRTTTANLTVSNEALSVSLRTNELIKIGPTTLTYIKEYLVMVVDAAGQAKPGVLITPSIDLPNYYKGHYVWNGTIWAQVHTLADSEHYLWNTAARAWQGDASGVDPVPRCPNEDFNRSAFREADPFVTGAAPPVTDARGEDLNWNGELDPRKADVAVKMVGSNKTDANGIAVLQIEYGKNVATWVDFVITVTASGIGGTEARARYMGLTGGLGALPALAADMTRETAPPAFVISPYGDAASCANPS